jgi:hypothetical protein
MVSVLLLSYHLNEKYNPSLEVMASKRRLSLTRFKTFKIAPNKARLTKLFNLLAKKESEFAPIWSKSDLISFRNIFTTNNVSSSYANETDHFLGFFNKQTSEIDIDVKDRLLNVLNTSSELHSFVKPRFNVEKKLVKDQIPVVLMAANFKYFQPLKEAILNVHAFFPDFFIYVYDLGGLDEPHVRNQIMELCSQKCKMLKFDEDNFYKRFAPHLANLINYGWKPLVIQVCS